MGTNELSDAQKFDATVRKVLSVSHDELKRREKVWKRNKARRKRARASRDARASSGRD
jgi:hypothetical protein